MARPQDQMSGQEQGPDSVRVPDSDPIDADLQQRMERLPPGHPSSPYRGDGCRKPPEPDSSNREYPIPGDPDYRPDAPGTPAAAETEQGTMASEASPDQDSEPPPDAVPDRNMEISKADPLSDGSSEGADDPEHAIDDAAVDEKPTADSQTDRSSDAEDAPRLSDDGSWGWKDLSLSPDQSQSADRSLGRCREVEGRDQNGTYGQGGLTPAMRRIEAQLEYSQLTPDTEKFALKGADRFKEKLAKLIQRYPGESPELLANKIHDGVRYTFLSETADYVAGIWEATDKLHGQGYEQIVRTNNWGAAEYKGVNTRWRDPESGLLFEVQFHTSESWDAKQRTHEAYEKINDVRTPVGEVERLRQYQREVCDKIPLPLGWQTIPDYRKDNR